MEPLLDGVRVVDASRVLAGPFAGQILAEMGADVVKVELPGGDPSRSVGPFLDEQSLYFASVNSGKRGVLVDPDTPQGRELLEGLLATADIVVTNFRPAAARALGLDYASVAVANPRAVMVSVVGYAQGSSRSGEPAYDLSIQAEAGILAVTGTPGGEPARAGVPITDLVAGMSAALGAVGGLVYRWKHGTGRLLEVPLLDATLPLLSYMATAARFTGVEPPRVGSGHHSIVPYGAYAAADGWLVIAVLADKFWAPLVAALELPFAQRRELAANPGRVAARAEIDAAVAAALADVPLAQALQRLAAAEVPHAPVHRLLDALDTPYVRERSLVEQLGDPAAAYARVRGPLQASVPLRPAPRLGEHTDEIVAELRNAAEP